MLRPFSRRDLSMQRLTKCLTIIAFCLQWPLPTLAEDDFAATCSSVTDNPSSLVVNGLRTELVAEGSFNLTCSCPNATDKVVGAITLSALDESITFNGNAFINGGALIKLSGTGDAFAQKVMNIPYAAITNYSVKVVDKSGGALQAGSYLVKVKFEADSPTCNSDSGG